MEAGLKIIRHPYEEPHHLNLDIFASNGSNSAALEIYCNATDIGNLGRVLAEFPRHNRDSHLWELGSEQPVDNFGFYFRLKFLVTSAVGRCAVQVRFNNNAEAPDTQIAEFFIATEAARINELGLSLKRFSNLRNATIEWTA